MYKSIAIIPPRDIRMTGRLRDKAKKRAVELQYNNGKPEWGVMEGIGEVNDSMELDPGRMVSWIEGRIAGLRFDADMKVCGDVRVVFRDKTYRRASDMPEELLKAYHNGTDPKEAAHADGKEYETPYRCDNNNWFEEHLQISDRDGKLLAEEYTVIDAPPDGPAALLDDIIELHDNIERS